jgi:branched-chain amino acid transport system permease protein
MRSGPWLGLGLVALFALVPLAAGSFRTIDLALKIALFGTLAASYDILLGYTGIVSFGHAMFFGLGAYAVALALGKLGAVTYGHLALGLVAGPVAAAGVSLLVGLFSLRVQAIFFAMVTLAFAEFAVILAVQLSPLTGGEDGLNLRLPGVLASGWASVWTGAPAPGVPLTSRGITYYGVLLVCLALLLLMRRFVRSPLGRTLQAIRDNALRAEALGYRTVAFQLAATAFASGIAGLLGGLYATWVRYVNPESALGIPIMLDVLLMVVIGGIGTLYGGLVGAAVLLSARTLLPDLRGLGAALAPGSEILQRLADRWLLVLGLLFVLVVLFFPRGILGTLRERADRRVARRGAGSSARD